MPSIVSPKDVQLSDAQSDFKELLDAGMHVGHKKSKTHPKMGQFLLGRKNEVQIINVQYTAESLKKSLEFIKNILVKNKDAKVLFVSTRPQFRTMVKETAQRLNMPFVINRWLGGTFTNFKTISKRLDYFKDLEKKKESGELKKYTKKEQMLFGKELEKLEDKMGGIKNLIKLPEAVFVVDANKHKIVIAEAKITNVPVVAIADTDADPTKIDYPIISNSRSLTSVKYILDKMESAISEAKKSK